jgi:hypothetical protein
MMASSFDPARLRDLDDDRLRTIVETEDWEVAVAAENELERRAAERGLYGQGAVRWVLNGDGGL